MTEESPAQPSRLRPRDFLRKRRPSYFSDTPPGSKPRLDRAILEYHLSTLTSRSNETAFERFARQLCERVVCPNLLPHTGPTGGGDSKVDTETFPVSPELALAWYVGDPTRAASERWAFAFSAKADWRPKLKADIAKIAATGRDYAKAFFVSSQFIPDRQRADAEDELRKRHGVDVRVLDRAWILDQVFDGHYEDLAIEALGLQVEVTEAPRPGPLDAARKHRLTQLEERIRGAVQASEVGPAVVDEALESAVLARELELGRDEVEGRLDRAARLAARFGFSSQRAVVAYERAWTAYWWFEDGPTFATHVEDFENEVEGTAGIPALRRLVALYYCAYAGIAESWTPQPDWVAERRRRVEGELARVASMEAAPSAALTARLLSLTLSALHDPANADEPLAEMADVVGRAQGLVGFAFGEFAMELSELGSVVDASDAFDRLHAILIEEVQRRAGDVAAGELHTDRAVQLYEAERYAEAIIAAGKALPLLFAHEARWSLLRALDLIADSYVQMGLPWAARGSWLTAASIVGADLEESGAELPRLASVLDRLRGVELFLGRLPQSLSVHRIYRAVESALLVDQAELRPAFELADLAYDAVLGQSLLRLPADTLQLLSLAPDLLERLGLPIAQGALLFTLGYPEELTDLGEPDQVAEKVQELRRAGSGAQIHAEQLTSTGTLALESRVLGVRLQADHDRGSPATEIAESCIAAIEGLMAAAAGLGVVGMVPDFRLVVRRGHFSPWPFRIAQPSVIDAPALEIAYPTFDATALTGDQQMDLRRALRDVMARVMARAFYLGDPEKLLSQVLGEEGGLDRALNFTGSFVTAGNITGKTNELGIAALLEGTERDFPLREARLEWPDEASPTVSPKPGPSPTDDFPPDLRRIRHDEMAVVSIIDVPLWDAAKWMGVGYAVYRDQPPMMILLFTNPDAARTIGHRWLKELGSSDEAKRLQISIVTGVVSSEPYTYRVLVGPHVDRSVDDRRKVVFTTVRRHEMNPSSDENLRAFIGAYRSHNQFELAIGALPLGSTDLSRATLFVRIRLSTIAIRQATDVKERDFEYVAVAPMEARGDESTSTQTPPTRDS